MPIVRPSLEVLVLAAVLAAGFAGGARRAGFLDRSGAAAGAALAFLVVGFGGWAWAVPSLIFFVLSSLLSRVGRRRKEASERRHAKGSVRDAGQVLANGGVGGVLLLLYALHPAELFYWGFLGAFAAAAADTWATELGQLSRARPRLLLVGPPVPKGTSGGISPVGLGAAAAGALAVAAGGGLAAGEALPAASTAGGVLLVAASGWLGSVVDSLAGATLQAVYLDPSTQETTERSRGPGGAYPLVRGRPWLDNDGVNLLATAAGALAAMACFLAAGFGS